MTKVRFELKWHGGLVKARERAATMRGLDKAADHLLAAALDIVPYETFDLSDTGTTSSDRSQLKAAVSFDGEYAVWQHEDLDLQHDAGRSAKYLETPFNTERDELMRIMAAELGQELT